MRRWLPALTAVSILVPAWAVDTSAAGWEVSLADPANSFSTAAGWLPMAPTALTLDPAQTAADANWSAPVSDGGGLLTYQVTAVPDDPLLPTRTCSTANTSCTLTGLTDGMTYTAEVTATNVYGTSDPSGSAGTIPYPASIMTAARLVLWLDGADADTLRADPGCGAGPATITVGCWLDKSVQGNDAMQANAGNRPAVGALSGRGVPDFDGASQYLQLDPSLLPVGTAPSTTLATATMTDPAPFSTVHRAVVTWGEATDQQARALWKGWGSDAMFAGTWNSGHLGQSAWSSLPGVAVTEHVSPLTRLWGSGIAEPASSSQAYSTAGTDAFVGMYANWFYWQGTIPEVIVFSDTLSSPERRMMEEYLARKWGSVITPAAPTSPAATPGTTTADLVWTGPDWDGGAPVSGYAVDLSGGAGSCSWVPATTTAQCTGLDPVTPYTFTIAATNSAGTGPAAVTATTTS